MTAVDDVRVEIAFDADPDTESPTFVDLTSRARLDAGIGIARGRSEQFDTPQPGMVRLVLDNNDGELTPGRAAVVTRTNQCPNPQPTSIGDWTGLDSLTLVAAPWDAGRSAARVEGRSSGATFIWSSPSPKAYANGDVFTASYKVKGPAGATVKVRARSDSGYLADASAYFTLSGGVEVVSYSFTVSGLGAPETMRAAIITYGANPGDPLLPGNFVYVGDVLIEDGSTVGSYFDGDSAAAGTTAYQWTGTANASTSEQLTVPLYANVKPQNRLRVTYRDPAVAANFVDAESATFEGGTVGGWIGSAGVAVASSSTRAASGTRSLLVTWPTAAAKAASAALGLGGLLTVGRSYTVRARVWVPAGHPPVVLAFVQSFYPFYGAPSTTTGAWETLTATFTATTSALYLVVRANAASTAGQQVWVDEIRVDEAAAPSTFTTDSVDDVIVGRIDGHVNEWPTAWPTGGQESSTVAVTAYDVTTRLARRRKLGSVIAETYTLDAPSWYFPLDETSDSTSAGDRVDTGSTLDVRQVGGSGGELEFGARTGPPTDGASAPGFTPVGPAQGKYLAGGVPRVTAWTFGLTLVAAFNTETLAAQTVARISDPYGAYVEVGLDTTGHAVATFRNPWFSSAASTSAAVFADGRTHTIAATITIGAGITKTVRLYVDGVEQGAAADFDDFIFLPSLSTTLYVGGTPGGRCLTGTVSHVAGFGSPLDAAALAEHYEAAMGGFAGERSDERIARVLSWVGFPTSRQVLDVGLTDIGHIDPTGKDVTSYLNDVAATEGGIVFADTRGRVVFHSRSRRYDITQPVGFSATADELDPSTAYTNSVDDLVNAATVSRAGGATARALDAASAATFGLFESTSEIYSASDIEAFSRAQWMVALGSEPRPRLPHLQLDALTGTPAARALEIGDRGGITGMPAQAPASADDVIVEGYSETISSAGWAVDVNATPHLPVRPLVLDDPSYGALDADNHLVY